MKRVLIKRGILDVMTEGLILDQVLSHAANMLAKVWTMIATIADIEMSPLLTLTCPEIREILDAVQAAISNRHEKDLLHRILISLPGPRLIIRSLLDQTTLIQTGKMTKEEINEEQWATLEMIQETPPETILAWINEAILEAIQGIVHNMTLGPLLVMTREMTAGALLRTIPEWAQETILEITQEMTLVMILVMIDRTNLEMILEAILDDLKKQLMEMEGTNLHQDPAPVMINTIRQSLLKTVLLSILHTTRILTMTLSGAINHTGRLKNQRAPKTHKEIPIPTHRIHILQTTEARTHTLLAATRLTKATRTHTGTIHTIEHRYVHIIGILPIITIRS